MRFDEWLITSDVGEELGDCEPESVRRVLSTHGLVQFSGFKGSLEKFDRYTERFGECESTRVIQYPPGGVALGFHAEDAYTPYRPDALWFVCLAEGTQGGSPTGVVDGITIFAALPNEWQQFCSEKTLRYDRQWSGPEWQRHLGGSGREVEECLESLVGVTGKVTQDGMLRVTCKVPITVETPAGLSFSNTILHAVTDPDFYGMALEDGSPIPLELVETVSALALQYEKEIEWERGDVAVIDNLRMMHRRREYQGSKRDVRARHCLDMLGTPVAPCGSRLEVAVKLLLQGLVVDPTSTGLVGD